MRPKLKSIPLILFCMILFPMVFSGCSAFTESTYKNYDTRVLVDKWTVSTSSSTRGSIVEELEKRKDSDGLVSILNNALRLHELSRSTTAKAPTIRYRDVLPIINAMGRLKRPDTIDDLYKLRVFSNKEVDLAILDALGQIGGPTSAPKVAFFYRSHDRDVRIKALNLLASFPHPENIDTYQRALFDHDENIRWRAAHLLGDLGNPESVGKISILLADKDESVRDAAEKALEKLKVPSDRIVDWKEKAQGMSIEGFYQTQLAYEKVVSEKQSLKEQLDAQQQVKAELEKALKDREDALKRKEDMLTSLYEKERQLTDKANQLELSALQSEKYSRQLKALNKTVLTLNQKLKESAGTGSAKQLSAELNEALSNKEKLEKEVSASRQTEQVLKREMVALEKLAKKARIEAANAQQQVERMQNREFFLTKEVDNLRHRLKMGMEPVVLISNPKDGASIKEPSVLLTVFAVDDKGVVDISVMLNGQSISVDDGRGLSVVSAKPVEPKRKLHFSKRLSLIEGQNQIQVTAVDTNGIKTIESITVSHVADRGQIFAAIIGINGYTNARNLKYAVNDAKKFKGYLRNHIDVPEDNILYLIDEQATKENILSVLGTRLKRKAGKEDTVFIFFAGHGAVETDPLNPDGDGFEKYLLPYDADLNDLYATSISMDEIQKIFQRINSNRLVFIVDSCYSGASGGRTILASRSRANLSEKFYERISKGKGRVIISSSSANEVSQESDRYQHGLFTYFLLEGLKGAADFDQDELVTVDEVFSYISKTVPQASGQSQHPVKKGQVEGELIVGRVK